jgi:hypothetical protein
VNKGIALLVIAVSLFDLHEVRLGYHPNFGPKEEYNDAVDEHSFTLVYGSEFRLKVFGRVANACALNLAAITIAPLPPSIRIANLSDTLAPILS